MLQFHKNILVSIHVTLLILTVQQCLKLSIFGVSTYLIFIYQVIVINN